MNATLPRVLVVDDEQNLLMGVARTLRGRFEPVLVASGAEAVHELDHGAPFDVVLSDMRMPGMDGVQVLAHARKVQPDATRLILSGQSDLASAVRAINDGNLFRFLFKPLKPDDLVLALQDAVAHRRLILSERELLEKTVTGAVAMLSDVLALTHPAAHGRASRIRRIVDALSRELGVGQPWSLQVAASMSQLGAVLLPPDTAARWKADQPLSAEERAMVARMPEVSDQLLRHIPRFEPVRQILSALASPAAGGDEPLPVCLVRTAIVLERALGEGVSQEQALARTRAQARPGDEPVLAACARLGGLVLGLGAASPVTIENLREGMVLAADVRARNGALLITRGHEVTFGLMTALRNFARTVGVEEPLSVERLDDAAHRAA